ncbi:hypothetical protein C9374_009534 [Naegleria lovaniensis]|uniref:Uncharacterized protein n=1 Tax=Naegleria lovaniensis TaxID=51637 RepID=A0AA88H4V8_NAELO|nr:uncharacterized protein C9374_009534 [Naegleria lovaniensis]KAG2392957.1 hypothetical protein C9374_009534 [Naegleria lovaniensis]
MSSQPSRLLPASSFAFPIDFSLSKVLSSVSSLKTLSDEASLKMSNFLHTTLLYWLFNGLGGQQIFKLRKDLEDYDHVKKLVEDYLQEVKREQIDSKKGSFHHQDDHLDETPENHQYSSLNDFIHRLTSQCIPPDLKMHAQAEALKTCFKMNSLLSSSSEEGSLDASQHFPLNELGLNFQVQQIQTFIEKHCSFQAQAFQEKVHVLEVYAAFTAILEYLSAEILELSSSHLSSSSSDPKCLSVEALEKGVLSDSALLDLPYSVLMLL